MAAVLLVASGACDRPGRNRVLVVAALAHTLLDSVHHSLHAHCFWLWQPATLPTILSTISARRVSGRNSVRWFIHDLPQLCLTATGYFFAIAGDVVAVNPDISSGLPIASVNRQPPPGSRPEKYSTPATKGSQHLHT